MMSALPLAFALVLVLALALVLEARGASVVNKPPYYTIPNVTLNGISPHSSGLLRSPFDNFTKSPVVYLNGSNLMGNYGTGSLKCLVTRESGEQVRRHVLLELFLCSHRHVVE